MARVQFFTTNSTIWFRSQNKFYEKFRFRGGCRFLDSVMASETAWLSMASETAWWIRLQVLLVEQREGTDGTGWTGGTPNGVALGTPFAPRRGGGYLIYHRPRNSG